MTASGASGFSPRRWATSMSDDGAGSHRITWINCYPCIRTVLLPMFPTAQIRDQGSRIRGSLFWYVECRIAREEPRRDHLESHVRGRHHRPLLGPRDVGDAHRVPDDDVLI